MVKKINTNVQDRIEEEQGHGQEFNSDVKTDAAPSVEVEKLLESIAEKDREIETQKNYALRMQADLENLRRRTVREKEDYKTEITSSILSSFLPVYDNLERALSIKEADSTSLRDGITIILRQFFSVLEGYGLEKVDAENCIFDPECHEAVVMDYDQTLPDGQITSELQAGYRIKGRLVRPAMVKVNKQQ